MIRRNGHPHGLHWRPSSQDIRVRLKTGRHNRAARPRQCATGSGSDTDNYTHGGASSATDQYGTHSDANQPDSRNGGTSTSACSSSSSSSDSTDNSGSTSNSNNNAGDYAGPMALQPTPQAPPNKHKASGDGDNEPAKKKRKGKNKGKCGAVRRGAQQ